MPTHAEKRVLACSPRQLFDLVADIECYPEFLPWCVAARIRKREGNLVVADLVIGFKMFRELSGGVPEESDSRDVVCRSGREHR